jgi:hypothetical protein
MRTKVKKPPVAAAENPASEIDAVVDGRHVHVTGYESIELRCGKARILLKADGTISLEGTNISSTAEFANKIRGGHIALN